MQRQQLDRMAPGLTDSKLSVFESCQEQKHFIAECTIKPTISSAQFQRLVRILGGAERVLIHPLEAGLARSMRRNNRNNLIDDFTGWASGFVGTGRFEDGAPKKGLFSFFTFDDTARAGVGGSTMGRAETKAVREYYASLCLAHFPRFKTGGYSLLDDDQRVRERIQAASENVVAMCEKIVDEMEPLGNVANQYITGANIRPGQAQVFSQEENRKAWLSNPDAAGGAGGSRSNW